MFSDSSGQRCRSCGLTAKEMQGKPGDFASLAARGLRCNSICCCWKALAACFPLMPGQGLLSAKILKALEWSPCPAVPEILPAVGQASAMFPRRSRINVPMWVHWRPPPVFILWIDGRVENSDWGGPR